MKKQTQREVEKVVYGYTNISNGAGSSGVPKLMFF